jgi:hypothetical protein
MLKALDPNSGNLQSLNNMKRLFVILFVLSAYFTVEAQTTTKVGTTSAQFLRIPVGTRSAALGGAVTAGANDLSSLYWNPASLAEIRENAVMLEYGDWFLDIGHSFLGVALPVGEKSTVGLSVISLDMGQFEETILESPEGTGRTFGATSMAVGVTAAREMFNGFYLGGTIKYIRETIWNTSSQTVAFDAGTTFITPYKRLRFGVSLTNMGGQMQMLGSDLLVNIPQQGSGLGEFKPDAYLFTRKFDLPLQMKAGIQWDAIVTNTFSQKVFVDGANPADNNQSVSLGTEITLLNDLVAIRAGLPDLFLEDRVIMYTAGIGINHDINENIGFKFGYALQQYKYLNAVNRLSLMISF